MKRKLLAVLTVLVILFTSVLPAAATKPEAGLTILFTHDMHDHILPMADENGGEYGGFARLATLLKQERAAAEYPVVTLDGGDFSMGTLYQTIFTTDAPELRLMGALGIEVTTLGNHEFDFRAEGLAKMLDSAVASGDKLPVMVQANYKPPKEDTRSWEAWENYQICDYTILERDGLRVAVFGLLGEDADACAPMSGMTFEPIIDAAECTVALLKEKENPDFIVCLSHSGTWSGEGEDYELAKAVDGIDVILSAHTHTTLNEPIRVDDTLIVSCGEYVKNLGVVTITKNNGVVTLEDYRLIPVDETVAEDPAISALADKYKQVVEREYLSQFGYTFEQVLADTSFDFTPFSRFGEQQEEDSLGNLIADSYRYAVQQAEGEDYTPVDFAVVGCGVIRGSFPAGEITVADAFNVSSLGSGADGTPGYPLVSVYLTGDELKDAFEVDASVAPLMSSVQLYGAGMTWSYNTNRMIFNKVTDCGQVLEDGSVVELESDKLYRVVTGLYSAQMLGTVREKSFGLLSIVPKDTQGNEITDFEAHIIKNGNGSEVKEWYALASYLESLEHVPENYAEPEGRKVVVSSWNPIELLRSPNWITLTVLGLILLILIVLILIVRAACRRRSRRRYGRGYAGGSGRHYAYRGRRKK